MVRIKQLLTLSSILIYYQLIRPWTQNRVLEGVCRNSFKNPTDFSTAHVRICVKDATPLNNKILRQTCLKSLCKKTSKSNHLRMKLPRQHFVLSYVKTLYLRCSGQLGLVNSQKTAACCTPSLDNQPAKRIRGTYLRLSLASEDEIQELLVQLPWSYLQ